MKLPKTHNQWSAVLRKPFYLFLPRNHKHWPNWADGFIYRVAAFLSRKQTAKHYHTKNGFLIPPEWNKSTDESIDNWIQATR